MAISKVVYKSSASATPVTWMDATPATAAAADITAPKTAMLADGVVTTGTGTGGGGTSVDEKDVNFIDYDGTLLYSYTAQEAQALTALPANPSHTGLTSQGWNWTLAQIKSQLTNVGGKVWVGQMYVTTSGKTEIDIELTDSVRLSPVLTIAVNGTISVDWGDNTTPDTVTGSSLSTRQAPSHTYANTGEYTISISVVSGEFTFYGSTSYFLLRKTATGNQSRVYNNCVKAIRIGSNITRLKDYAFYFCTSLQYVTIPSTITTIDADVFYNCYSLVSATLPSTASSIGTYTFCYCYSLRNVSIPSNMTSIPSQMFSSCWALGSVTIPSGVTSIGESVFTDCHTLKTIALPSGITSLGTSCFYACRNIVDITLPSSLTSIGASLLNNCSSLRIVIMPSGVKNISNLAFGNCYSLTNVTLSNDTETIEGSAFSACYGIASLTIPSKVTSIGNSAFSSCYGMKEYHFLPTTVPTAGTTIFSSIVSDCIIYVPYSADHSILNAYQTADNWSTYATYMQEEPQS